MLLNNLYTIQSIVELEQTIKATIVLNKEHAIFQGHFPDNPIVPGVCLMTMVKETLEQHKGQSYVLKESKSVKFLGIVNPTENSLLEISCNVTPLESGELKTNSAITVGDKVCYKASAVYTIV